MEVRTLTCPYCNGQLNVNLTSGTNTYFCTYCGNQIYLDDGSTTINYNVTYRETNDANIQSVQSNERVRLREIESNDKTIKRLLRFMIFLPILCIMVSLIISISEHIEKKRELEINRYNISIPYESKHYEEGTYIQIQNELKDLGFKNIELIPMGDLKIGLLKKENDVDNISINGKSEFSAKTYFEPEAPVKIYYHSYPEDSAKENDSKTQENNINNSNKITEDSKIESNSADSKNSISIPYSSSYYTGENYVQIQNELKDLGFTNIEVLPMGDLKIGFLKKENDIDRISIGGKSKFDEGDSFEKDAPIKIYYHSYPEKDNDSK